MHDLETLAVDTKIGPFRIIRPIKEAGGMATLYLAEVRPAYRSRELPDRIALKVARGEYEDFLRVEADILARLRHQPHIVQIYPMPGTDRLIYWSNATVKVDDYRGEKVCFMAMEYLGGGSLRRQLDARRSLDTFVTAGIARQVADGLAEAHRNRIVHLDVKPENVLFRTHRLGWLKSSVPNAVLCDFGLARDLTSRALTVPAGTEAYMAPELFLERDWNVLTPGADVYMLGAMLYEMLTGQLPFDNPGQKLDPNAAPRPLKEFKRTVSAELEQIVLQALRRRQDERYTNAAQLAAALASVPPHIDLARMLRQTVAGVAAAGILAGLTTGGLGLLNLIRDESSYTPTPNVMATPTRTPAPWTPEPTDTPGASTATPVNTFTPTLRRPTRTATPISSPAPSLSR